MLPDQSATQTLYPGILENPGEDYLDVADFEDQIHQSQRSSATCDG